MCCGVKADYIYSAKDGYICPKCQRFCAAIQVCAECMGTGEVASMERVYPGEHHMASIGTRICDCKKLTTNIDDNE